MTWDHHSLEKVRALRFTSLAGVGHCVRACIQNRLRRRGAKKNQQTHNLLSAISGAIPIKVHYEIFIIIIIFFPSLLLSCRKERFY